MAPTFQFQITSLKISLKIVQNSCKTIDNGNGISLYLTYKKIPDLVYRNLLDNIENPSDKKGRS